MRAIGVIPARWGSTRFEGKILADINGKPMIEHVWQRSRRSRLLKEVLIACDDDRILKAAKTFGAKAVLTSKDHTSGTDRVAQAVADVSADIIVNIQGDEPLIHHSVIDSLVTALSKYPDYLMATAIKLIRTKEELENPNVVKAVIDAAGNALYFSRSVIPYDRDRIGNSEDPILQASGDLRVPQEFFVEIQRYAEITAGTSGTAGTIKGAGGRRQDQNGPHRY